MNSVSTIIDQVLRLQGVQAVAVIHPGESEPTMGGRLGQPGPALAQVLRGCMSVVRASGEHKGRVVLGEHSVSVQRIHGYEIAALMPTGHPAAKSLRRTMKRAITARTKTATDPLTPATQAQQASEAWPPRPWTDQPTSIRESGPNPEGGA